MTDSRQTSSCPAASGQQPKYWAFFSHSHRDRKRVHRFFHQLEAFRIPSDVEAPTHRVDPVPDRIRPNFLDEYELPTSSSLGKQIDEALFQSRFLLVFCSPDAARSNWVNQEILEFKRLGRADRILAVILDGEPNATHKPGDGASECFPEALRFQLTADGTLGGVRTEPLAADLRPGRMSKRFALLKIVAGITGVPFDSLYNRDAGRRLRWRVMQLGVAGAAAAALLVSLFLWWMAKKDAELKAAIAAVETARADDARRFAGELRELRTTEGANPFGSILGRPFQDPDELNAKVEAARSIDAEIRARHEAGIGYVTASSVSLVARQLAILEAELAWVEGDDEFAARRMSDAVDHSQRAYDAARVEHQTERGGGFDRLLALKSDVVECQAILFRLKKLSAARPAGPETPNGTPADPPVEQELRPVPAPLGPDDEREQPPLPLPAPFRSSPSASAVERGPGKTPFPVPESPTNAPRSHIDYVKDPGGATKAGDVWNANELRMKFCWCPAGTFLMGSPMDEKDRDSDESQVSVTLNGFWLGKHEVTQSEWTRVMGTTLKEQAVKGTVSTTLAGEGPNHPMYYASHDEATEFARKLTQRERAANRLPAGWEYRLPTEAQWEYGCRAGTKTRFASGDDVTRLETMAWFAPASEGETHAVGSKRPNAWGLCDMHGNLWEWCLDWHEETLPGGTNPEGARQGSFRVVRGGCWLIDGNGCRSAERSGFEPADRWELIGFRMAMVRSSH